MREVDAVPALAPPRDTAPLRLVCLALLLALLALLFRIATTMDLTLGPDSPRVTIAKSQAAAGLRFQVVYQSVVSFGEPIAASIMPRRPGTDIRISA